MTSKEFKVKQITTTVYNALVCASIPIAEIEDLIIQLADERPEYNPYIALIEMVNQQLTAAEIQLKNII